MNPLLSVIRSHRGNWSPASLFTGANGLWLETDLTTMFQDSAGTTPVTTNTNPVGLWKDKSGNNNHVSQATSTNRPTYSTTGHPNVLFNGTNQWLHNSLQVVKPESAHEIWVAAQVTATGERHPITAFTSTSGTNGSIVGPFAIGEWSALNITYQPSTAVSLPGDATNYALNTDTVFASVGSGNVGGNLTETLYVNNAAGVVGASVAVSTTYDQATLETLVGSYAGAPSLLWQGPIYAIVAINRALTTGERASLKTYLAAKYGGVL